MWFISQLCCCYITRLLQSLEEKELLDRLLTETGKDINEYKGKKNESLYLDWLETWCG